MKMKVILVCITLIITTLFFLSLSRYFSVVKKHEELTNKFIEINEIKENEIKENIPNYDDVKLAFLENKSDFQNITKILIKKFENKQVFIKYMPNSVILYNDKIIESDNEIEKVSQFLIETNFLKKRDGFAIAYQVYVPTNVELGGTIARKKFDVIYNTKVERVRIDFYLYEGEYARMGLKYLSVDDLNTTSNNEKINFLFGEKIIDGWYYYVDPNM